MLSLALVGQLSSAAVAPQTAGGRPLELSAWLNLATPGGIPSLEANAAQLARVYIPCVGIDADSMPMWLIGTDMNALRRAVKAAHAKGTKVFAVQRNMEGPLKGYANVDRLHRLFVTAPRAAKHQAALFAMLKQEGFDGLMLDYGAEEIVGVANMDRSLVTMGATDRPLYPRYLQSLVAAGHAQRIWVGVCFGGDPSPDLVSLAKTADLVAYFVYLYQWVYTTPHQVMTWSQGLSNANWALTVLAPSKTDLVIMVAGVEWKGNLPTRLGWSRWLEIQRTSKGTRDPVSQEMKAFLPGGIAFMSDAQSFAVKPAGIKQLGFRGTSLLGLGLEDPAIWAMWPKLR